MAVLPRILVTAGPTHEPIDDVRYIGNRSSGRMGIAIATAAARRGCPTTLLLGPVGTEPPQGTNLQVERFRTAAELAERLDALWPRHDLLVMAAAVADFRPTGRIEGKRRRDGGPWTIALEPVPDLLAALARNSRPDQRLIGFALEPAAELAAAAAAKLRRKGLHAIVANPLETMDAEMVEGALLGADGSIALPPSSSTTKAAFAEWLVARLLGEA